MWLLSRSLIRAQSVNDDQSSPGLEITNQTDQDQVPGTSFQEQDTSTEPQQHGPLIELHHSDESDQGLESSVEHYVPCHNKLMVGRKPEQAFRRKTSTAKYSSLVCIPFFEQQVTTTDPFWSFALTSSSST